MTDDLSAAVESYLLQCFQSGTAPRVDELAALLKAHPSVLSRAFKAATGRGLAGVMKERQLDEARRLLATTDLRMAEIARRGGFGTVNTLFRLFRLLAGETPAQFRTRSRQPPQRAPGDGEC